MKRPAAETAAAVDAGGLLFDLLRDERLEGFEKSFKMADKTFLSNRYLLGIPRAGTRPEKLLDVCRQLVMPAQYLTAFNEGLPRASTVHFGFEEHPGGGIYKVYLEFAGPFYRAFASASDRVKPILLHLAYKWDVLDAGKCTIAKYVCHPRLSKTDISARLGQIYSGHADRRAFEAVLGIIELAAGRTEEPLMYLEVTEADNPRYSFDINLHAADMRLRDIEQWLSTMRSYYSIAAGPFDSVFAQVCTAKLAHLSGGVSRDGRDFLTVYYAAEAR